MIQFKTKTEAVFQKIRQNIIDKELKPGERVVISEIAKEFGISEIPVREAIRKLESEGLVKFTPHVGAVVSLIEGNEFLEIYLMRIELEALATRLSTPHMKESDIRVLKNCLVREEKAIKAEEYEKLRELNKDFHLRIYTTGPYPYLCGTIVDLWERFDLMQSVFVYVPKSVVLSWEEHKQIVEALAEKNARLAVKLVRQQKNRTRSQIEKVLKMTKSQSV